MRYPFGDSTESALELNYLAFLRDAIELGVAVMQADAALAAGRERRTSRERAATEQVNAVEEFGRAAIKLAEPIARDAGDTPRGRAATSVAHAAAEAVRREAALVRASLASDLEVIEGDAQRLRARCLAALGVLLQTHDLPDAESVLTVRWTGTGYEARMRQKTAWAVEATLELDIPSTSPFAHDLKVERIADGVEIHAPESAGWIKKEMKMVPHKLARHLVTQVTVDKTGVTMALRATPEPGAAGFDVAVSADGAVTVVRPDDAAGGFDTDERDQSGLRMLAGRLEEAALSLTERRGAILSAAIDDVPVSQHAHPRLLIERLVAAMTPTVLEIARHSLAPNELVLKRLLAGDRREEIFVSKAELAQKIEPLAPALRRVFAPLGIVDDVPEPPPRPGKKTMPPPSPPPRVSAEQTAVALDNALRDLDDS
jgi:hypothetical protein